MQVNLDEETVQFIKSAAKDFEWNPNDDIIPDASYANFGEGYEEDCDDHHNLVELLYRLYTKNLDKFEGV